MGSLKPSWIVFFPLVIALVFTGLVGYLIFYGFEAKERYTEQIVASHNIIDAASGLLLGFYYAETGEEIFPIYKQDVPSQIESTIDVIEYYTYLLASSSQVKPHRQELVNTIIIPMVNFKKQDLRNLVLSNRPFSYEEFEMNYDERASEHIKSILTELIIREQADLFELSDKIANDRMYINVVAMLGLLFIAITIGFAYVSLRSRTNENINLIKVLEGNNISLHELNQQLISNRQRLEEFMSIAAHDLRSPLTSILSVTNVLQIENKDINSSNTEYLNYIRDAVSRMTEIIEYLLDNKNNKLIKETRIVEFHVADLINQIIFSYTEKAAAKKIQINFQNNINGRMYMIDRMAVSQIIDNLISNAVKFSPNDKKIQIEATAKANEIIIKIKDEGQGFKNDELSEVFQLGKKLSAKPTGNESSTGLGLYIVKTQVDELNGEISMSTEENKGTEFTVRIPI